MWVLDSSKTFSVHSFYHSINDGGVRVPHLEAIWKIRIPGRVRIFSWLLSQNKLLTRDNFAKRRVVRDDTCLFFCVVGIYFTFVL